MTAVLTVLAWLALCGFEAWALVKTVVEVGDVTIGKGRGR